MAWRYQSESCWVVAWLQIPSRFLCAVKWPPGSLLADGKSPGCCRNSCPADRTVNRLQLPGLAVAASEAVGQSSVSISMPGDPAAVNQVTPVARWSGSCRCVMVAAGGLTSGSSVPAVTALLCKACNRRIDTSAIQECSTVAPLIMARTCPSCPANAWPTCCTQHCHPQLWTHGWHTTAGLPTRPVQYHLRTTLTLSCSAASLHTTRSTLPTHS